MDFDRGDELGAFGNPVAIVSKVDRASRIGQPFTLRDGGAHSRNHREVRSLTGWPKKLSTGLFISYLMNRTCYLRNFFFVSFMTKLSPSSEKTSMRR